MYVHDTIPELALPFCLGPPDLVKLADDLVGLPCFCRVRLIII